LDARERSLRVAHRRERAPRLSPPLAQTTRRRPALYPDGHHARPRRRRARRKLGSVFAIGSRHAAAVPGTPRMGGSLGGTVGAARLFARTDPLRFPLRAP